MAELRAKDAENITTQKSKKIIARLNVTLPIKEQRHSLELLRELSTRAKSRWYVRFWVWMWSPMW